MFRNLFSSASSRRDLPMPAVFAGRYLLTEAASEGEFTFVWKAREIATNATVALKFFPARWVAVPAALKLARELVAELRLLHHPALVSATDLLVGDPWAAFVSPWVEGPTLGQMLCARPSRVFNVEELQRWLPSLLSGIEAAHARGLAHGGLEPGAVIQHDSSLRVLNPGVAVWLADMRNRQRIRDRQNSRTPYFSPARRRGEMPRAADDVYALGAMTYELLAGTPPETGGGWGGYVRPRSVARQRRRNGLRGGDIPQGWERTLQRCLEPRERDRLGSVREMRMRLELNEPSQPPAAREVVRQAEATAVGAPAAAAPTTLEVTENDSRGLRVLLAMVTLATAAVGGALCWKLVERFEPFESWGMPAATDDRGPVAPAPATSGRAFAPGTASSRLAAEPEELPPVGEFLSAEAEAKFPNESPTTQVYELGRVDEPPRLLRRVDPPLPPGRVDQENPVRVELIVVIDRRGYVSSARIRNASEDSLAVPSLEAVRSWFFRPAVKDGRAVAVRMVLPLVFPDRAVRRNP